MSRALNTICILLLLLVASLAAPRLARGTVFSLHLQSKGPPSNSGSISGKVVTDSGRPVADAPVILRQAGVRGAAGTLSTTTSIDGAFEVQNVPTGSFSIAVRLPGYILVDEQTDAGEARLYRPGEFANIVVRKGGVITGKVLGPRGEPLVGMPVTAVRVSDFEGKTSRRAARNERQTDDRGVYRLYGLQPGNYVVEAGGEGLNQTSLNHWKYRAPTFHPSETRNTAKVVRVETAAEVENIDILFRDEPGHVVSGRVNGLAADSPGVSLSLMYAGTSIPASETTIVTSTGEVGFALYGIPDGNYDLFALSGNRSQPSSFALSAVKVAGADILNLNLTLQTLSSASGSLELESSPVEKDSEPCPATPRISVQSFSVKAQLDSIEQTSLDRFLADVSYASVNEHGEFSLTNLRTGISRLGVTMPNDQFYLKSISLLQAKSINSQHARPIDLASSGLAIKPGNRIETLLLTVADRAAAVEGKVVFTSNAHPDNIRIYLIPAEPQSVDAIPRYAEAAVKDDGAFSITNLAPGKYFLLAHAPADTGKVSYLNHPSIWVQKERAELKRLASAKGVPLDLKPCARASNLKVAY